jgi:phosphate-selective porin
LKQQTAAVPDSKFKGKVTDDGKTYVEKAVPQGEKPPIYVQQRGSEIKLVLGGFIQVNFEDSDAFAFNGNFGESAIKDRFRLRRARVNLTGDFAEQFDFKVEGDFGQNDGTNNNRTAFSGTDIWLNWHQFPGAQIKIGQFKAPFGLDQLTPDTSLYTIERTLPTGAITPDRQIGAQLWGMPFTNIWPRQKDLLTYYAGIFNGNGKNTTVNDNNNFMYVGRLESTLFKDVFGKGSFLKLGADVLNSRDDKGTNISQSGNLLVNSDGSLSPFVLPGADERTAWSVDAWVKLGPFDLIGEYLQEHVNGRTVNGVPPGFADFTTDGYYVTAGYFLIPKKLQAVVQWQDLNPGQKGDDGLYSILGGLNYYIHGDDLKVMVNYIHTWSDFRQANPEFGQDEFDQVLGRIQVMF